ncbi:MAG TPA: DMT family transporter, partial [Allocoleopsis sp.]
LSLYGLWVRQQIGLRQQWRSYLLLGFLNNVVPFLLIATAVANLNASIAAILNATTPLFTAIVAAIWLKEPLNGRKITGLILGITGVAILVGWSPLPLSLPVIVGGICALIAAFSYGVAAVYARRTFWQNQPLETAIGQLTGAGVLLLPIAIASSGASSHFSIEIAGAVFILAAACTAFAYWLYFQLIASAGAVRTATVTFLVPIFGLLFGKILLAEPVNLGIIVGLITILLSVWLVIGAKR